MRTRYFVLTYGVAFLLVGIAGFIPGLVTVPGAVPGAEGHAGHGRLLGLFPVNTLHNIVHLLFGIWGLAASRALNTACIYARCVAVIYAVFAFMGLIPGLNTVWGLIPLHGHDVWLHALLAAVAAWFGWARLPEEKAAAAAHH